jgi:hypothetical protein
VALTLGDGTKNGHLTFSAAGTLQTPQIVFFSGSTFSPGTGKIIITATSSLPNDAQFNSYNDLQINSGATVSLTRSISVGGNLTIQSGGEIDDSAPGNTNSISVTGSASISGLIGNAAVSTRPAGVTVNGTTSLVANISIGGALSFVGNVTQTASVQLLSTSLSITGTFDTGGNQLDLVVTSVTIDPAKFLNLGNLSSTPSGVGTTHLTGSISSSGFQHYNYSVTLDADTTLSGTDMTLPSVTGGTHALSVSGTAVALGAVSTDTMTGITTLSATGATTINAGTVTTTSTQTYNSAVTLGADTALNAGAAAISFSSSVNGAHALTVTTSSTTTFTGSVGGGTPLTSLSVSTGNAATLSAGGGINAITVSGTGSLTNAGTLTVTGALSGGGTFNQGNGSTLLTGGPITVTTFNANGTGNDVNYTAANPTVVVPASGYVNLDLSGSGTPAAFPSVTISGNLTVTGTVTATTATNQSVTGNIIVGPSSGTSCSLTMGATNSCSGSVTINNKATLKAGSNFSITGDVTIGAGGTLNDNGQTVSVGGNWSNSGTLTSTGTIVFNGGTQTLDSGGTLAAQTFNAVTCSGTTLTLINNAVKVSGAFTNSAGTFDANTNDLSTTIGGLATLSGGTFLAASTNGIQTFNGGLTFTGGTLTGSGGTINVTNLTLTTGTLTAPTGAFNVSGNWSQTGGTFTPGTGTVTFNASSGMQTLNSGGTAFNNITHNAAGTLQLVTNALQINGTFIDSAGSFDPSTNSLATTITGMTTLNGGSYSCGTATQSFNGGLTISAGGTLTGSTGTVNAASVSMSGGTLTAPVAAGAFNVSGNWSNAGGTFTPGTGTVTFTGAAAQTLDSGGTAGGQRFNSVTHSGAGTVQLINSPMRATSNFTNSAGTFDLNGNNWTVNGTLSNPGTIRLQGGETVTLTLGNDNTQGTWLYVGTGVGTGVVANFGYFNLTINTTVNGDSVKLNNNINIANNLSVSNGTLNTNNKNLNITAGLTINGANAVFTGGTGTLTVTGDFDLTASGTFTAPTGVFTLSGNWTRDFGTTINPAAGATVTFAGSTNTAIQGTFAAPQIFNSVTVNKNAANTLSSTVAGLTLNGSFTLTAGKFTAPSGTLSVAGNFTGTANFNANSGTVNMTGATQTIAGTTTFYNLSKTNHPSTLKFTAGTTQTVSNQFTITGASGSTVKLRSTTNGTQWSINTPASPAASVTFSDVRDSIAAGATITANSSTNSGNDVNWNFGPVPSPQTWVGGDATFPNDWGTANNWSAGVVPDNTTDITIPGTVTAPKQPVLDQARLVKSFTMNSTSSLDDGGNSYSLTVSNAASTLTMAGSILNTTNIIFPGLTVNNTGGTWSAGSTLTLQGAGTVNLNGGASFGIIAVNGATTVVKNSTGVALTITGLSITAGTFDTNAQALTVNGNVTDSGGTLIAPAAAAFNVSGNWNLTGGTLTPNGGTVTFNGGAQSVTSGGQAFFNVTNSATTGLTLADVLTCNSLGGTGATTINGSGVTSTTTQTYGGAVTLGATVTLQSTNNNAITFSSTVDGTQALTVTTSSTTTFTGAVGTTALKSFTGGTGTTQINGRTFKTTTFQTYNGPVTIGASPTPAATTISSTTSGNIQFTSTVDGAPVDTQDLTVNGTAGITFSGAVGGGATGELNSLTVSGATLSLGAVKTHNNQSYTGTTSTTLSGSYNTSNNGTFKVTGAAILGGTTAVSTGSGTVMFTSTVDGANTLNVNTSGTVTFSGAVGGTALSSLSSLGTGTVQINGGSIKTNGGQAYSGAVTLGAGTTLTDTAGANISFSTTLDGGNTLAITNAGFTTFTGAVGNGTPLTSFSSGTGKTLINGGLLKTTGAQTYNGPVGLNSVTSSLTTTTNGAVGFGPTATVDGISSLTITTAGATGTVTFGAAVGQIGNLNNMTVNSSQGININANVTVSALPASTVTLNPTTGGVTEGSGPFTITTPNLLLTGAGAFALGTPATLATNQVGTLAANVTGNIQFINAAAFTIGTVGTTNGVATNGGNATLNAGTYASPLALSVTQPITTAGGSGGFQYVDSTVTISGSGSLTLGAGNIALNDDDTKPVPTITLGQPDPTNNATIIFNVVFENSRGAAVPVKNFTAGTFGIPGGQLTIGGTVTPSKPTQYQVVQNTQSSYTINVTGQGNPTPSVGTVTVTFPANTVAVDAFGLTNATATSTANFDNQSPVVNPNGVTRVSGSPTNAQPSGTVQYTVAFSKPVQNVTAADFSVPNEPGFGSINPLSGVSISTPITPVGGVSPATTWTVTINTGSGDGTLGLDVLTTGTLRDTSGNKLLATAADTAAGTGAPLPAAPDLNGSPGSLVLYDIIKTLPAIVNITSTTADGVYNAGASVNITVSFSFNVTLTGGNLLIPLDTGAVVSIPPFASNNTATGTYIVGPNDSTASDPNDNLNVSAPVSSLSGGTLQDIAHNNCVLNTPFPNFAGKNIKINAPPLLSSPITVALDPNFDPVDQANLPGGVALPNQTCTFSIGVSDKDLSGPFPVASNVLTYAWDFGDGTIGSGATPTHQYAKAGSYTIKVLVNDSRGGAQLSATTTLLVNTPPQVTTPAAPDFNPTGFDTQTTFSVVTAGSNGNDVDGDALVYNWDFGDGTTATGATVTHFFASATFPKSLIAADGTGRVTVTVTITDPSRGAAMGTVVQSFQEIIINPFGNVQNVTDDIDVTNPAQGAPPPMTIQSKGARGALKISVLNAVGTCTCNITPTTGVLPNTAIHANAFFALFRQPGVYVVTAVDTAGNIARKMIPITLQESMGGDRINFAFSVDQSFLSGRFSFKATQMDKLAFRGRFPLTTAQYPNVNHTFAVGLGNVVCTIAVDAKGHGKATKVLDAAGVDHGPKVVKSFRFKFVPRTGKAVMSLNISMARLDQSGFDSSGVIASFGKTGKNGTLTALPIQVAVLIDSDNSFASVIPCGFVVNHGAGRLVGSKK